MKVLSIVSICLFAGSFLAIAVMLKLNPVISGWIAISAALWGFVYSVVGTVKSTRGELKMRIMSIASICLFIAFFLLAAGFIDSNPRAAGGVGMILTVWGKAYAIAGNVKAGKGHKKKE